MTTPRGRIRPLALSALCGLVALGAIATAPSGAAATRARAFDFNGDGYADLAFGAPGANVGSIDDAGVLHVLYGTPKGPSTAGDQLLSAADTDGATSPQQGAMFGAALASADFDANGYADLVVGSPGQDTPDGADTGQIVVFKGSARGLRTTSVRVWRGEVAGVHQPDAGGQLGWSLATGDYNDDGRPDLAMGAPQTTVNPDTPYPTGSHVGAGAVLIVHAAADGLAMGADSLAQRFQQWHQDSSDIVDEAQSDPLGSGGMISYERFGASLSTGDFDADGNHDLAIGVSGEFIAVPLGEDNTGGNIQEAGALAVLYGTDQGLTAARNQLWHQDSPGIKDKAERRNENDCENCNGEFGDHFGAVVAAGDFDDDGYDDIAVGVPDEAVTDPPWSRIYFHGAVAVLYGSASGISARDQFWTQDSPGVPGKVDRGKDQFGAALAVGDFDRDGRDDLAIGAPGESMTCCSYAGMVAVLFGTSSGLTGKGSQALTQDKPGVPGVVESDDRFGFTLHALNLGRGAYSDLVVGVPGESIGDRLDAGMIEVFYGSSSGISFKGVQAFSENTPGVAGVASTGDRLGHVAGAHRAEGWGMKTI